MVKKHLIVIFIVVLFVLILTTDFGIALVEIGENSIRGVAIEMKEVLSFLELRDTPSTYVGHAQQCVVVNTAANGLEFVPCNTTGSINYSAYADIWLTTEGQMDNVADLLRDIDIFVNESGDTMTGDLNMSLNNITDIDRAFGLGAAAGDIFFRNHTTDELQRLASPTGLPGISYELLFVVGQLAPKWSLISAPAIPSWASVLGAGRITSGQNPQITAGDNLEFRDSNKNITSYTDDLDITSNNSINLWGNVGIGTSTPAYLFETKDTGLTTAVNLSGVLYINANTDRVGIGTTAPARTLQLVDPNSPTIGCKDTTNNAELLIQVANNEIFFGSVSNHPFSFMTGWTRAFKIDTSQEVQFTGIKDDGTGKVVCIKSDGNLGTCTSAVNASGSCTCA